MATRYDTERNRTAATQRETREYVAIMPRFAAQGIAALYGGGEKSKGHGFWLQRNGVTVRNDEGACGNPSFWLYEEALALLDATAHYLTLQREEGYQEGYPAPMFLRCECGLKVALNNPGSTLEENACRCGIFYRNDGLKVTD